MVVSIGLGVATYRVGLGLRRARLSGARRERAAYRRHLRLAKPAVTMLAVGFLAGPLSAWLIRDWTPFATLHSWVGALAISLFAATAFFGRRLETGRAPRATVDRHAWLALSALLAAALAAFTGFVLLP
jgi:hypothetical protein